MRREFKPFLSVTAVWQLIKVVDASSDERYVLVSRRACEKAQYFAPTLFSHASYTDAKCLRDPTHICPIRVFAFASERTEFQNC